MKSTLKSYIMLAGLAGVVIILDQWTKSLVRSNLAIGEAWVPWSWLMPYARILHWKNTGAAFGLGQNLSDVITVFALVVVVLIIYYYPQVPAAEWPLRIAMGMQLGGALGNLIDRMTIGHVTDFISVGNFPVFNVADSSISMGVVVLLIGMWWQERKEKQIQPQDEEETVEDGTTSDNLLEERMHD